MLNLNMNWPTLVIKSINHWWPVVKSNFAAIQSAFNGHVSGTADKHTASSIINDSAEPGESVKEVMENTRTELNSHYTGALNKHSASSIVNDSSLPGDSIREVVENNSVELNNHYSGEANRHTASIIINDSAEEGGTVEEALNNNKARFDNHITGTFGTHAAENISYSGSFVGKDNVKAALEQAKSEIDTIVINASKDPEVAIARSSTVKSKTFTTLDDRLEESELEFINLVNNMSDYETTSGSQAKADTALSGAKTYTDQKTEQVQTTIQNTINTHLSDYTMQIPWAGVSTNAGNAYSIASPVIAVLVAGMAVSFKCNADSTGAVTLNWSGTGDKSVLKANNLSVTNWKSGGVYTLRYDGTNFRLQGEGGDYGTAQSAQVLSGYSIGTNSGLVDGTMVNHTASNIQCTFFTDATISEGYYNGTGKVLRPTFTAGDTNSLFHDTTNDYKYYHATYTKVFEKTLLLGGTLRISFPLRPENGSAYTAYARIYRNGTAVGIERSVNSNSYVLFTEDISGWLPSDKIQIYLKSSSTSSNSMIEKSNGGIKISVNETFVS
ncbi:hypothetical protein [Clostridium sp. BNL1100]|uniref:hypothetical protein n=1 Tax=Clostridium sp. BNL1100 TaxID=755731 RepID=UPI00024A7F1C|nr:hypothetical protein [Clostridium sp. BNL1100]AEY65429.1 hypothetical protein Clo1100_1177 [Clostridium sp. BNL1100]